MFVTRRLAKSSILRARSISTLARSCVLIALLAPVILRAQANVLMNRYDPQRTGANLSETTLSAANVDSGHFGRLRTYAVDGAVLAQPLYVRNVTIGGSPRNVLYVATMNDKVYAFDTNSATTTPLWMADFTHAPAVTPIPITDITSAGLNVVGNVGIQSTPVIDQSTGTIYVVARTKESGTYVQRLHALSIATGQERQGSPVKIAGSVPGTAPDSTSSASGRMITFDPKMQLQRAGLALVNGVVLIAWAGHEDLPPYHGWIMAFDAVSLARVGIMSVSPDAYGGGVWQGGRAPTIDASGNAYFATGNGKWDGSRNFGNSLLKLHADRTGIDLVDYFTPGNEADLNPQDYDLSGSGFTLLPGTNLLLGGGKEGVLYLLNAGNLGHKVANDKQIVQRIPMQGGHVMGGPVFWNSGTAGPLVYNWSEDDVLKAYRLSGGRLATTPLAQGQVVSPGHPGGSLTVSAKGSTPGTGVIWASLPTSQDGLHGRVAGVLRAFNADTLQEIWTSEQNASRDRVGTLSKFVPPVVADGRVYLATYDNQISVYGLFPPASSRAISVDFVGSSASMAAGETAGVVARPNWNHAVGASRRTPQKLVDETGAPTSATITWSASGVWATPITDQAGNRRMMKGYLDTTSTSQTTISVSGLPLRTYDVYVYADGDNRSFARTAAYTLGSTGGSPATIQLTDGAGANFSGTFTLAAHSRGNYVRFTTTAGSFVLTAKPLTGDNATLRAPVNGLQIVPRGSMP